MTHFSHTHIDAQLKQLMDDLYSRGASVGIQDLFKNVSNPSGNSTKYPPHNIIKLSDTEYQIELAVAGFTEEELQVSVKENMLVIKSNKIEDNVTRSYEYHGIALRNFTKEFVLSGDVVVKSADLKNGLLKIDLEKIVPESKKPRTIKIGNTN